MGKTWKDEALALEVWKHYGSIGGADKDRMVKIVTWLLGFSAAIVGLHASGEITQPLEATLLIFVGVLVSLLAAFIALLYGCYAAWNWSIADQIACEYKWTEQEPSYYPFKSGKGPLTATLSRWLAGPCEERIAPVFWIFFGVSFLSLVVHMVILCKWWAKLVACGT